MRSVLLSRPWWLNSRWPDGLAANPHDDRCAAGLFWLAGSAISVDIWFEGRSGRYSGVEPGLRWLLLFSLFTGVVAAFAVSARTRRSRRYTTDDSSPSWWASPRLPDGRRVGDDKDRVWQAAHLALLMLVMVMMWIGGRVGVPTEAGAHIHWAWRSVLRLVYSVALFAGVVRLGWFLRHTTNQVPMTRNHPKAT